MVLANAVGARGTRGNGRSREAHPPPLQGEHEGNRGKWGGPEAGGKGAAPPPPPRGQVPRNVLASCPQRARPGGRGNKPDDSSRQTRWLPGDGGKCLQCACNMLVTKGGDARREGHRREPHACPPPPPERECGEPKRAGRPRKEERTQRERPPPPRRQVPRLVLASCSQRACSGGKATRAPPPSPPPPHEGDEGGEGTERGNGGATQGVTTRPEGETGGKQWGHRAA